MDPFTALGVAGNVLQIIQVGTSTVSKSRQIYKSADESLHENADTEAAASNLRWLTSSKAAGRLEGRNFEFLDGRRPSIA
jgi:hypothetical protein